MGYLAPAKEPNFAKADGDIRLGAAPVRANNDMVTTLGHGMLITGNVVCAGAINVFGRIKGDVHAAQLVIAEGGRVDGNVVVQSAVIQGTFRGTIHGGTVKMQGNAVVQGEIHNKSLIIEPNAIFEGISLRLERAVEPPMMNELMARKSEPVGRSELLRNAAAVPLELTAEDMVRLPSGMDREVIG